MKQCHQPRQDWPEQKRSLGAQWEQAFSHPGLRLPRNIYETGIPDLFVPENNSLDEGLYRFGGPIPLIRQDDFMQHNYFNQQEQQPAPHQLEQLSSLSGQWNNGCSSPGMQPNQVIYGTGAHGQFMQHQRLAQEGLPQQRSRNWQWNRGCPHPSMRPSQGMNSTEWPDGSLQQLQQRDQGQLPQRDSQHGHWDERWPCPSPQLSRAMYRKGGEDPFLSQRQIAPQHQSLQQNNPVPQQHFMQQLQLSVLGWPGQPQTRGSSKKRCELDEWHCPKCLQQFHTRVSFKRHKGWHLSQGCRQQGCATNLHRSFEQVDGLTAVAESKQKIAADVPMTFG